LEELHIGKRIRDLRKKKGMSLAVLAEKSETSAGLISQIERNLVAPSVFIMYRIAQSLDIDISYFFNTETAYNLQRKGTHQVMSTNHGLNSHILLNSEQPGRPYDFLYLILKGGEHYKKDCIAHNGEECVYILSGTMHFIIDDEELVLNPGDSLHFNSTHPHLYLNKGKEDCESIWVISPRFF